jgi:hypothetical protein
MTGCCHDADDIPHLAGTGRPARRDARPAGPVDPAGRLTVTAEMRGAHPDPACEADPAHDELAVTDLVTRARNGQIFYDWRRTRWSW